MFQYSHFATILIQVNNVNTALVMQYIIEINSQIIDRNSYTSLTSHIRVSPVCILFQLHLILERLSLFAIFIIMVYTFLLRYGQMTAGSYCYIGPQGIVHGTTVRYNYLHIPMKFELSF